MFYQSVTSILLFSFRLGFSQDCNPLEYGYTGSYFREKTVNFVINLNGPEMVVLPLDYPHNVQGWSWIMTGLKSDSTNYLAYWIDDFWPDPRFSSFCGFQENDAFWSLQMKTLLIKRNVAFYLFKDTLKLYHWVHLGTCVKYNCLGSHRLYLTILHISFMALPPVSGPHHEPLENVPAIHNSPAVVTCEFTDRYEVFKVNRELQIFKKDTTHLYEKTQLIYSAPSDPGSNIVDTNKGNFVGDFYNNTDRVMFIIVDNLILLTFEYALTYDSGEFYCNFRESVEGTSVDSRPFVLGIHFSLRKHDLYTSAAHFVYGSETEVYYANGYFKSFPLPPRRKRPITSLSPFCYMVCSFAHGLPEEYTDSSSDEYFDCVHKNCQYSVEHSTIENLVVSRNPFKQLDGDGGFLTSAYIAEIYTGYRLEASTVNAPLETKDFWENYIISFDKKAENIIWWIKDSDSTPQRCMEKCYFKYLPYYPSGCLYPKEELSHGICVDSCLKEFNNVSNSNPPSYVLRKLHDEQTGSGNPTDPLEDQLHYYRILDTEENCVPLNLLMFLPNETTNLHSFRWMPIEFIVLCGDLCSKCATIKPYREPFMKPLDTVDCVSFASFTESLKNCMCFRRCIFQSYMKMLDQSYGPNCLLSTPEYTTLYLSHKNYYYNPGFNQQKVDDSIEKSTEDNRLLGESEGTIYAKTNGSATFRCIYPYKLYIGPEPIRENKTATDSISMSFLFFPKRHSLNKVQRGVKIFDFIFSSKALASNGTNIKFAKDAHLFVHNTFVFNENNSIYVILKRVNKSYDGLYECVVHFGDVLHQFSIVTVLKIYGEDLVFDLYNNPDVQYVFAQALKPFSILIPPFKEDEKAILLSLRRKEYAPSTAHEYKTFGTIQRQFKDEIQPDTNLTVKKEVAPKVELHAKFEKELEPNDFRFVHAPSNHDQDVFLLIKTMPDSATEWVAVLDDHFLRLEQGGTTAEYSIEVISWTDQYYHPYYQPQIQWYFKVDVSSASMAPGPVDWWQKYPSDTTACYAVCTALFGRRSDKNDKKYYECLDAHSCNLALGKAVDFNNLVWVQLAEEINAVNTRLTYAFYNALNRMTGSVDLKPSTTIWGNLTSFTADERSNPIYEANNRSLYASTGFTGPIDDEETFKCVKQCPMPFSCINPDVSLTQFDCMEACIANGKT